jgi:hypothetical protein
MLAQRLPGFLYIPHAIKGAIGPFDLPCRVLMPRISGEAADAVGAQIQI